MSKGVIWSGRRGAGETVTSVVDRRFEGHGSRVDYGGSVWVCIWWGRGETHPCAGVSVVACTRRVARVGSVRVQDT